MSFFIRLQLAWTLYFCSESSRVLSCSLFQSSTALSTEQRAKSTVSSEEKKMEFPLNILPPEMIDLIANRLPILDRLHFQDAFARDPEEAVTNIRNGLAVNLGKRALYLLMDLDEYDSKYQYNYQLEGQLPNAFLPTLEGLPISSESSKIITLSELERIRIPRLKEAFSNVVELKVVLRDSSLRWLTKLIQVVKAFSRQLTALQLLIFSDGLERTTPWDNNYLQHLFSHLNKAHFDRLQHFTLLFEDTEETSIYPDKMKPLRLLSSETLKECYLRLPGQVLQPQLELLEESEGLQRLGIIASYCEWQFDNDVRLDEEIETSPSLDAKIVHLMFQEGFRSRKVEASSFWQMDLIELNQFTSLRILRFNLNTDGDYLTLMETLSRLGSLKHLELYLDCVPVPMLTLHRLSQLAPCSPSVTHLKIEVASITGGAEGNRLQFSHLIFAHLSILRHFPNLQQLEVVFPPEYSCSLCEVNPGDDGRECMEKAMQPFRALDKLNLTFRQDYL